MESFPNPKTLLPGWTNTPIPNFSLSASGLIVLADLSTVAQRTALRGGSSWLDFLLLVPGLHYQQAADELARHGGGLPPGAAGAAAVPLTAIEVVDGDRPVSHRIVNQAVVNYVLRTAREGRAVVLDVGEIAPARSRSWRARGRRASVYALRSSRGGGGDDDLPDLGWAAHLLYLASPVLTCVAAALIVLLGDWWALALLVALMISRVLNIFVIKQRSRAKPQILPAPFSQPSQPSAAARPAPRVTQYIIDINPLSTVILRGLSTDLQALTTTVWLRPKTHIEGYLEATAKVLVYLVAACSGNATQAGNLVLLTLVLVSAGLLALSNAHVKGLRNGGRVVAPSSDEDKILPESGGGGGGGGHPYYHQYGGLGGGGGGRMVEGEDHRRLGHVTDGDALSRRKHMRRATTETWPESSDLSSLKTMEEEEDIAEKGQGGIGVTRRSCVSDDDSVDYRVQMVSRVGVLEVVAQRHQEHDDRGGLVKAYSQ